MAAGIPAIIKAIQAAKAAKSSAESNKKDPNAADRAKASTDPQEVAKRQQSTGYNSTTY